MAEIDALFRFVRERDCSDLHLAAESPPHVRLNGALQQVPDWPKLDDRRIRKMLQEMVDETKWNHYLENLDLDFAYALEGIGRFRCNFLFQERGAAAVFRLIPEKVKTLEELRSPPVLKMFTELESGLVLVTGPTGSGKSTTLAAIIDAINTGQARHIITIEDPVEFVHQNKSCTLSQREVGKDTTSFATALRAAIRQDPGVILVGELRDMETIALAITAAEMGVLVFATLHTNSAAKTIDRLIDAFPTDQQGQVRTMLSESLAGVVSQLLLRTASGAGRVAVHEILIKTPGLPNIIREGNTPMIASIIQGGKNLGMQSMDDSLYAQAKAKNIDGEEAYLKAVDKRRFEEFLNPEAKAEAAQPAPPAQPQPGARTGMTGNRPAYVPGGKPGR
ncbi:MAG: type IV pilus twitching motility protein PilT [Myxococcaceae bacterium]